MMTMTIINEADSADSPTHLLPQHFEKLEEK